MYVRTFPEPCQSKCAIVCAVDPQSYLGRSSMNVQTRAVSVPHFGNWSSWSCLKKLSRRGSSISYTVRVSMPVAFCQRLLAGPGSTARILLLIAPHTCLVGEEGAALMYFIDRPWYTRNSCSSPRFGCPHPLPFGKIKSSTIDHFQKHFQETNTDI